MSYKIARSYKIVILLRNANFMTILASKMLFVCEKLLDKKIFSSFSRKFGYLFTMGIFAAEKRINKEG